MAKQTEPKPPPPDEKPLSEQFPGSKSARLIDADKRRFVNRNPHLSAAAKIVAVLEKVDPAKWDGILKTVRDALQFQPELPGFKEEEAK